MLSVNKRISFQLLSVPAIVMMAQTPGFAVDYLTVEEAQQIIFPGENFKAVDFLLSEEQQKAIKETSDVSRPLNRIKIWRTDQGGYFFIDEVIGKHELITYAVGIESDGRVRQVEIMDYREAHGAEIRQKRWRRQFVGKTSTSALNLNDDIKNISGATLSCRHITQGVKRLLNLYDIVIKK